MAKYRKLPVVIEAEQYREGTQIPDGVCITVEIRAAGAQPGPHVHTLEGPLAVADGDWIITGVKGEQYPCKDDIFRMTYEPVEAPDA